MKQYIMLSLVLLLLAAVLHGPLLTTFFDPQEFITVLNPLHRGETLCRYMVDSWSWIQDQQRIGFFRPVISLSFMAEYPLWGINPVGYRVMNIVFHLCVALASILLARRAGVVRLWWLVPLIILVHPGSMDAVWLIVARHDVLAVLFSMVALILTLDVASGKITGPAGILPWAAALLAIGSKELGIANILALPVVFLFWPGAAPERKAVSYFWISAPAVLLTFLAPRFLIFGNIGGYSSYTALSLIPRRIYMMLMQGTGIFFLQSVLLRYILAAILFICLASIIPVWRKVFRKLLLLVILYFVYGFQSVISDSCMHYVYVQVVFFALMTSFILEQGLFSGERMPRLYLVPGGSILLILFIASLHWSSILGAGCAPRQRVFEAVAAHAYEIIETDSIAVIRRPGISTESDEMKNFKLFLGYACPDNDVVVRYVTDESQLSQDESYAVWADGDIYLGSAP